jgi:hypothetical protein
MFNITNLRIILIVYLHVWVSVEFGSHNSGRIFVSCVHEQGAEENDRTGVEEGL